MFDNNIIFSILKKIEEKYSKIKENTKINEDIFTNSENIMDLQKSFNKKIMLFDDRMQEMKFENFTDKKENSLNLSKENKEKEEKNTKREENNDTNKIFTLPFGQISLASALSSIKRAPSAQISIIEHMQKQEIQSKNTNAKENTKINTKVLKEEINSSNNKEYKEIQKEKSIVQLVEKNEKQDLIDCNNLVNSLASGVFQK